MDTTKALLICLLLLPTTASAHSGRTNAAGCHNDNKNGGYHCHNSDAASQTKNIRTPKHSANANPVKPQLLLAKSESAEATTQSAGEFKHLVLRIQNALNQLGYGVGEQGGVLSEETVKAMKQFQVNNEMVVDGNPSESLLDMFVARD